MEKEEKVQVKTEPKVENSTTQKYKVTKKKQKLSEKIAKFIKKVNKKRALYISTFLIAVLVIVLIIIAIGAWLRSLEMAKYKGYESKMDMYNFSRLYNNKSAKTEENLTKLEALKVVISTVLNLDDISTVATAYNSYEGETWVKYALFFNIIDNEDITADNKDDSVTYEELVRYFVNAKKAFLNDDVTSNKNIVIKNAAQFDASVQVNFASLVESGIIEIKTSNIDVKQVAFKGLANEIAVNFLEKYFTISDENARLRKTDMPSKENEYPYILFDIPTKIYDYNFVKVNNNFKNPKELYKDIKDSIGLIEENVEGFLKNLYTVDYTNIKDNTYTSGLVYFSKTNLSEDYIKEYCQYVTKNKIKIDATTSVVEPCIYYDGEKYRARVEIKLNINSPETKENLLFGDSIYGKITYDKNEYTVYVDVELSYSSAMSQVYIKPIYGMMSQALNKSDLGLKIEKNN